jgi:hypothetical protein
MAAVLCRFLNNSNPSNNHHLILSFTEKCKKFFQDSLKSVHININVTMKVVHVGAILNKLQIKIFYLVQFISLDLIFSDISKSRFLGMKIGFGKI